MGNQMPGKCCVADPGLQTVDMDQSNQVAADNYEFQLCKKGDIQDQKIEIEMQIQSQLGIADDEYGEEDAQEWGDDLLSDCKSLSYQVEIGELHERDKYPWTEVRDLEDKKVKKINFDFKLNHIKQSIKVEINGNFVVKGQSGLKTKNLYTGYYNFARCIKKDGMFANAHQIGFRAPCKIDVQVALQEKSKQGGGYRCISLKAFDGKGGDFVEDQDLAMVIVESQTKTILAEFGARSPLQASPEGLYKAVEIGVNNYDPQIFMQQSFQIFFFRDDTERDENEASSSSTKVTVNSAFEVSETSSNIDDSDSFQIVSQMKDDRDTLNNRLEHHLVAYGQFTANDIIQNSLCSEEFTELEPVAKGGIQKQANKPEKRASLSKKDVWDKQDEEDQAPGLQLTLMSKGGVNNIGMINLRSIQCKRRTSFLSLIANQMLEIVPIIGIDFSMSNFTFDSRKCIHTVNEDNPNEYRDLLSAVSKAYKLISPISLFYGFGANSVKKITEVSDLFVGTGDLLNPVVMTDQLEQQYYSCLKRVELNLPVHFSSIISKTVEFASKAVGHFLVQDFEADKHALTYFAVYIFCTGIIDDLDASVKALAQVINLPITFYIVQIQHEGVKESDADIRRLEEKCQFLFQRANRKFLRVMTYHELGFQTSGTQKAMNKLTDKLPFSVEQYFDTIAPRKDHLQLHIQQNQMRKGLDLVREVLRQKEQFVEQACEETENLDKQNVNKLIEEFKLYEYSAESAEILLGFKKRVEKC